MLSRISTKKVKGRYRNFYIQVPNDWAERMEARGVRHVEIEAVGEKGVLVVEPVNEAKLTELRKTKRRASRRSRYARR
jgi:bifunctional DNA-binding transcriptional regulator/antitoxin component of YhaV-PrlF toxin-antitoxin module